LLQKVIVTNPTSGFAAAEKALPFRSSLNDSVRLIQKIKLGHTPRLIVSWFGVRRQSRSGDGALDAGWR
jgi:hypothetical protein